MTSTDRRLNRFRAAFAGFIALSSIQTVLSPSNGHHSHTKIVPVIAAMEAVAALMFLVPRLRRVAFSILLMVFMVAVLLSALSGEIAIRFVFYAATAFFIVSFDEAQASGKSAA